MQADSRETIVAPATASGRAGVAVLRLSGPQATRALDALCGSMRPTARLASLRRLHHPQTGELLDQGLVLFFPGPQSFTGEDVVEFQVHGSHAVVSALLDALTALPDVRLAQPGEFARRAFEHRKLDLTELEGLADLIDAETESQRRQALRLMEGALSTRCEELRASLLKTLAYVEAYLDFPDEDLQADVMDVWSEELGSVRQQIAALLAHAHRGEIVREGYRVVLLGVPNAGKSSLLNALAQRDVAIVTPAAGTTRDVLEVRLNLEGHLMLLADTAGLRDTTDTIEQEGIRRARHYAEQAQLRLWLFDPTQEHTSQQSLWSDARPGDFVLWTKTDEAGPAPKQLDGWTGPAPLALSARSGEGIPALLEALKSRMLCDFCDSEDALLARARHREALVLAQHHLVRATEVDDLTLKAEDIRLSIRALSTVIGVVGVDDILDVVFSAFCLGK